MAELDMDKIAKEAIDSLVIDGKTLPEWIELLKDYKRHEWISVEDRLPEKHRYVLVHLRWGAIATGVHNGRNWWDELSLVNNDDVTHWMLPPEPPKEET